MQSRHASAKHASFADNLAILRASNTLYDKVASMEDDLFFRQISVKYYFKKM